MNTLPPIKALASPKYFFDFSNIGTGKQGQKSTLKVFMKRFNQKPRDIARYFFHKRRGFLRWEGVLLKSILNKLSHISRKNLGLKSGSIYVMMLLGIQASSTLLMFFVFGI